MTNIAAINNSILNPSNAAVGKKQNNAGFQAMLAQLKPENKVNAGQNNIVQKLKIPTTLSQATSKVDISANLNASDAIPTNGSANFTRAMAIFDKKGNAHDVNMEFTKTGVNEWSMKVVAQDKSELAKSYKTAEIASGTVSFNNDGSLKSVSPNLKNIDVKWAEHGKQSLNLDFAALTQFSGLYTASISQNGAPKGDLESVIAGANGKYTANYTNGLSKDFYARNHGMQNNLAAIFNQYDSNNSISNSLKALLANKAYAS